MRPSTTGTNHRALREETGPFLSDDTRAPDGDDDLDRLVQQLVDRVTEQRNGAADEDNVILDVEIDGVRCLLVLPDQDTARARLSPREREIVRMVADGYPNKTIAASLQISTWTVSTHLRRIFAKLGVNSRAAMVARLAREHPPI